MVARRNDGDRVYMNRYGERVRDLALVSTGLFRWLFRDPQTATSGHELDTMLSVIRDDHPKMMREFVEGLFATEVSLATTDFFWRIAMQQPQHIAHDVLSIYAEADFDMLEETLANLDIPAAVFHGGEDSAATLERAKRVAHELLSNGHFEAFRGSGHAPFIEERMKFNRVLYRFIESQ